MLTKRLTIQDIISLNYNNIVSKISFKLKRISHKTIMISLETLSEWFKLMNDKNKVRIEHLKQQSKNVIIGEDANNIVIIIVIVLVWMDLNSYKKILWNIPCTGWLPWNLPVCTIQNLIENGFWFSKISYWILIEAANKMAIRNLKLTVKIQHLRNSLM